MRNTAPIITWVQLHLGSDLGTPRVGAGPKVKTVRIRNNDQSRTREEVEDWLKYLGHEGVGAQNVLIVTCAVSPQHSALPLSYSGSAITFNSHLGAISVATPLEIKGLEAKHVLVVDVDDLDSTEAIARAYVALTRASVSLWVALGEKAWNSMQTVALEQISRTVK